MAIITNGNSVIKVNDYIYPKEDINIYKSGTKIGFKNNHQTLEIEYTEISSPTSTDIDNLIQIVSNYINQGSKSQVVISGDNGNLDAFGRLRVSQVNTQVDLKQLHDALPLFYDIETIGTGSQSHSTANAESTMTTSAINDAVIMQTKQRMNYLTGKSALMLVTFRNFNTQTNITKRIGYFNSNTTTPFDSNKDGIYLENDNGTINFVIEKDGTPLKYEQSTWNDSMDGTGVSGVDLQLGSESGNYIMLLDYEWLGVGKVRLGFVKDGNIYYACGNDFILSDGVYMSSPNHSIRAEIRQNGVGSGSFNLICATYGTEGNINNIGAVQSANLGSNFINANSTTTKYALIGAKLQSNKLDSFVDVLRFNILSVTNDNLLWELWLNPTVAGTFTYNNITNSDVAIARGDSAGTNTVTTTNATCLYSGYSLGGSSNEFEFENAIRLGSTIDGIEDEVVLVCQPLTSNLDVFASLTWRERT